MRHTVVAQSIELREPKLQRMIAKAIRDSRIKSRLLPREQISARGRPKPFTQAYNFRHAIRFNIPHPRFQ